MTSAAILAGGQARRFEGRDKGALVVDGRTIRARQLDALAAVSDDILIVERIGQPPASASAGVRFVADRLEDCGPLAGLETALREARHDRVIVVAGDMPFLTASFLAHVAAMAERTQEADVVVPRTESGYHPLCAVYARRVLPVVTRHLRDRRFAMTDLVGALRRLEIPGADLDAFGGAPRLLANVNTAAEYAALGDPSQHTA
jgi:molybdopterin-guanine dinucleotide biosynthesis protein A